MAERKSAEKRLEEGEHTELKILNIIYALRLEGWYSVKEILHRLKDWDPEEFAWLKERRLSNILRRFGLDKRRIVKGRTQVYISRSILGENMARFGIPVEPTSPPSNLSDVTSFGSEAQPPSSHDSNSPTVEEIIKSSRRGVQKKKTPVEELAELGVVE